MTDPRAALAEFARLLYSMRTERDIPLATFEQEATTIAGYLAERGVLLVTEADCIRAAKALVGLADDSVIAVDMGKSLFAALSGESTE